MPIFSDTQSHSRHAGRLQNLASLFSLLFGLALICNTHPLGDGQWFWYAKFFHRGTRLYANLHLTLQPLFILQTDWNMLLFGDGWLASKIPAVVQLIALIAGLRWLASYIPLPDWQNALLLLNAFCISTLFVAFRFDDYHVLTDCLEIVSILVLIRLYFHHPPQSVINGSASLLGLTSGLAISNRLNDGGMLLLTVLFVLWVILPRGTLIASSFFIFTALFTVVGIAWATGDTFADYASNSILHAAGSKGGTGPVLLAPILFPLKTLRQLLISPRFVLALGTTGAVIASLILLQKIRQKRKSDVSKPKLILLFLPLIPLSLVVYKFTSELGNGVAGAWMLIGLFLGTWIVLRIIAVKFMRAAPRWSPLEALFLIPLGQLLSSTMSSGGFFLTLLAPVGLFLLLLPLTSPIPIQKPWQKISVLVSAAAMLISSVAFKSFTPFSWHTYIEPPLFTNRQWYRHPLYGPMYIETASLNFVRPVCEAISGQNEKTELLSLPFPYANYFCGVAPWHGYVQTFFDIASKNTMEHLMTELEEKPPTWILYQRQMETLWLHELFYNKGKPLVHRALDSQIMKKLASGQWRKDREWNSGTGADWILIRTRS